jgi:DNA-binding NtrC family response regulator
VQPQPAFEGAHSEFGLVGDSPQIQSVLRIIKKLSHDTSPILILGESGVGKELVARAVHEVSPLAAKVFLPVDAATLVGSLMESELFGHVKGAFTGAIGNQGLVRSADGGTLFLDEIGELTPPAQAKLLRLLQEQEVRPVGSAQPVKVNVRILAATNRDLEQAIKDGAFRDDLYYRLKVVTIRVPPLRERKSDILPLARHFVAKYAMQPVSVSDTVIERFLDYPWPGNVRELENTVRRMVALQSKSVLREKDLPTAFQRRGLPRSNGGDEAATILPLSEVERRHILRAVEHVKGDLQAAAHLLGIGKTTLYRKLRQYSTEETKEQGRLFG